MGAISLAISWSPSCPEEHEELDGEDADVIKAGEEFAEVAFSGGLEVQRSRMELLEVRRMPARWWFSVRG